jgi:hypothetical protein
MRGGVRRRSNFIIALEPAEVGEPLAALAPVAVRYKPFNKEDLLAAIGRAGRIELTRDDPGAGWQVAVSQAESNGKWRAG